MINTSNAKVGDIMSRKVLFANLSHSFTELCRLFFELNIHHLPVINEAGELVGMLTSNDVLKAYSFKVPLLGKADEATLNAKLSIYDLMTPQPLFTINPEATIKEAARLLSDNKINALPVMEAGKIVGIITSNDVIRHCALEK